MWKQRWTDYCKFFHEPCRLLDYPHLIPRPLNIFCSIYREEVKHVTKKVCYITSPVLQYFLMNVIHIPLQGQPFNFHYYVVITRSHMMSITKPGAGKKRKKNEKDEATAANDGPKDEEPPTFDHFENEILQKVGITSLYWRWPCTSPCGRRKRFSSPMWPGYKAKFDGIVCSDLIGLMAIAGESPDLQLPCE